MERIKIFKKAGALILLMSGLNLSGAFAQDEQTTRIVTETSEHKTAYLGARYMFNVTDFQLKNMEGNTVNSTFVVGSGWGGELGFYMSRHTALQLEVMYNRLAQEFKDNDNVTQKVNLSYINVPLLFVLNTNSMAPVNLNLCIGPQMGFNTASSISASGGGGIDTVHAVLAVKKNDIGLAYGAGLDFLLGESLKLSIGYRGVQGLVDISDNNQNITTNDYYVLQRSHVRTNGGYAGLSIVF